ncbi:MAG: DUF6252 family protein [Patiriisocius sp.]|uniref:DUF6252 family protein n=1 Tax=Patiriisocius sp. TaxID=2822396 RepID=UPI003EF63700
MMLVFSCAEDIQDYNPAIQGFIDNELYRAVDSNAKRGIDGDFLIEGLTQSESLIINLSSGTPGSYNLGGTSLNSATFEDFNGNKFFTNPNGEGEVIVTELNTEEMYISGNFNYKAIQTSIDSIVVRNGVFFRVPYTQEIEPVIVEPTLPIGPCNSGFLVALIDGDAIDTGANICVQGVRFQNQIVITATDFDEEIQLRIPVNIGIGPNVIPQDNFLATYTDLVIGQTREAEVGSIIILDHNIPARSIRGTFRFNTGTEEISGGGFEVTYQ